MMDRRTVLGSMFMSALIPSPLAAAVRFNREKPGFDITLDKGGVTPIFVHHADFPGVRRAAADLSADIGRVTGTEAHILQDTKALPARVILVGTLGASQLIDAMAVSGKIDVSAIRGQWEAFSLQTVANPLPGVTEALVIVGSDKRGTIYGIYDLSRTIGVSPWYWWADVPVMRRSHVRVSYGHYVQGPPAVKYRGIFLNDEAPCLSGWTTEKFGGMNAKFYSRLFELLLRLRVNYLWPAMWNNSFDEDDPDNPRLAQEYGIVMGTSHHEPMMRAHKDWTDRKAHMGNGQWNYATNREPIRQFFREGIERNRDHEVIVTVGMRGDGDTALESSGSLKSDVALLEEIISDQRSLIAQGMSKPADQVPQVWVLFTEVYKYYDAGLKLPDDVTLMFADDNVGNLRRLPLPSEKGRKGGFGIYFHMDMHGGPFSYQWINSNPLPKIWEQMNLAHEYGANQIWIANVGDLKPLELPIEFFIAMAWDPAKVGKDKIAGWTRDWAACQFGEAHAEEIAFLLSRYAKYNAWKKPEQLTPDTYSLENYREAERVCAAWDELVHRADAVNAALARDQRDAFYQLVLYPVRACANLTNLYVAAARNARFANQARASTRLEGDEVRRRFRYDAQLRDEYNHTMSGGKWNHMMDQTHIGYFDWYPPEENIMPAIADVDVPQGAEFGICVEGSAHSWPGYYLPPSLLPLDSINRLPTWLEAFARGTASVTFVVTADKSWVTIREDTAFGMAPADKRFWIDVDWHRLPHGTSQATVTVACRETGKTVDATLTALRATPEQEREAQSCFGGLTGGFSIPVTAFRRSIPVNGVRWESIPDYGRFAAAMSVFPVTAPPFADPSRSPKLEYDVFLGAPGDYHIDLVTSPTLQVIPGMRLSVAVALDDQPPVTATVFTADNGAAEDFLGSRHPVNTAGNARTMRCLVRADRPGRHVLSVAMIDPTLVLQTIIVSRGNLRPSYFGPNQVRQVP